MNLNLEKPFIIAEIGGNHEGSLDYAKDLLIQAAEGGADAVKFQTYYPDKIVSKVEYPDRYKHFLKFWRQATILIIFGCQFFVKHFANYRFSPEISAPP